jgi:hypothetical protein
MGIGPMTGRGRGNCQGAKQVGNGNGLGRGQGRGNACRSGFCLMGGFASNNLSQPRQDELKKN